MFQDRPEQGSRKGEACAPPATAAAAVRRGHHATATAAAGRLRVCDHTRTRVFSAGAIAPRRGPPRPAAPRCVQYQRDLGHSSAATAAASGPQRQQHHEAQEGGPPHRCVLLWQLK